MARKRHVQSGFDHGDVPTIACFNRSTLDIGVDFDKLVAAMQVYVDKHVAPAWGTPAKLKKTKGFKKGCWALVLLDKPRKSDHDSQDDEGWHDLTPDGFPLGKVFVQATLESKDLVSMSVSHELVEMLVDPAANLMTTGPNESVMYSYESADPVSALSFNVKGIPMSDFVYPAYFESFRKQDSARFDHLDRIRRPFQVLAGGYQQIFKHGELVDRDGPLRRARSSAMKARYDNRCEQRQRRERYRTSKKVLTRRSIPARTRKSA